VSRVNFLFTAVKQTPLPYKCDDINGDGAAAVIVKLPRDRWCRAGIHSFHCVRLLSHKRVAIITNHLRRCPSVSQVTTYHVHYRPGTERPLITHGGRRYCITADRRTNDVFIGPPHLVSGRLALVMLHIDDDYCVRRLPPTSRLSRLPAGRAAH